MMQSYCYNLVFIVLSQIMSVDKYVIFFDIFHNIHVFGVRFLSQSDLRIEKYIMIRGSVLSLRILQITGTLSEQQHR